MEYDLFITHDGAEYYFDNQVDRFLMSMSGVGIPPIRHLTYQTPFSHGEIWQGYKLEARSIRVEHIADAGERLDFWTLRRTLMDAVRPNRGGAGVLRKILDDGSMRDITVRLGSLTLDLSPPISKCGWYISDVVEFIAHDPIYFDPVLKEEPFTPAANANLSFPITFPISFGESDLDNVSEITYSGSWPSYPIIEIEGPIDSPTIINATLGVIIKLDYSVKVGETVTVDLSHGVKSVVSSNGAMLRGVLSSDSTLSDFRLECDPFAEDGVNSIQVSGGGVGPNTAVTLKYYERFIGI